MVIPCIVTLMVRQVKWGGMLTIPNPKHLVVLTILNNLQPMNSRENSSKGKQYPK